MVEDEVQRHAFLTSALGGGENRAHGTAALTKVESSPMRKMLVPAMTRTPFVCQLQPSHCNASSISEQQMYNFSVEQ